MADSGFDIDLDQIHSAAPTFHRESVALERATQKLKHSLAGLGSPWGDDEQGAKFEDVYSPHLHAIENVAHALTKGLASIHGAMKDMAGNHEEADHSSASGFQGNHGGGR
ncbi:hypothetical protein SSP35_22_00130 [Streptomyces sp. NBRC 110611]|uniref:WXG100 family type VII secretion target n=1 Tax=Streptomyces sp. NBRC 110611 TaxID=1621259 RepID=UPI0008569996|nr:hypothetical protein [Streptomyces sp. NBRC 110611]GAU70710.1 hypothetical protein SSP35_22_00130 [Streptomyces sp. NBRC 110611]